MWVPSDQIGKNVKGVKAAVVQGSSTQRRLEHRHGLIAGKNSDAEYVQAAIRDALGVKRGRPRKG